MNANEMHKNTESGESIGQKHIRWQQHIDLVSAAI